MAPVFLLGVDWADEKHDWCSMDEAGKALDSLVAPHTLPGLESLRDHVQGAVPSGSEILCALETNHGLLVAFLLSQGWTVYPINPKSVDRYRERTRAARVKSDQLDAWLLADILRMDRYLHRPLAPDSVLVRELRELTRDRESLVQEGRRLTNQLVAYLKAYWPESLRLFPNFQRPWALDFLAQHPAHEAAAKASPKDFRAFLKTHRYPPVGGQG